MKYPTIIDYIEAVSNIQGRLMSLTEVNPIFDRNGEVIYNSGKGYVNFKVHVRGQLKVLRCFTSIDKATSQKHYVENGTLSGVFLDSELYVFMGSDPGDYFPVMMLDDDGVYSGYSLKKHDYENAVEGLCAVKVDEKWGFCNTMGEVVVEARYDNVSDFSEGRSIVSLDGLYGMVDREGNMVIDLIYDDMSWNDGTLAYVDRDGKHGCLNRMGESVVPLHYHWVGEFNDGLAVVELDSKFGYVNLKGELAIALIYDGATSFTGHGTAGVRLGSDKFRIDTKGEKITMEKEMQIAREAAKRVADGAIEDVDGIIGGKNYRQNIQQIVAAQTDRATLMAAKKLSAQAKKAKVKGAGKTLGASQAGKTPPKTIDKTTGRTAHKTSGAKLQENATSQESSTENVTPESVSKRDATGQSSSNDRLHQMVTIKTTPAGNDNTKKNKAHIDNASQITAFQANTTDNGQTRE